MHWGCQLSLKNPTPSFLRSPPPLKSAKCPSLPFLGNFPLLIGFFVNRPLKIRFFSEPQKYSSFSSLTPSYLLKITKFLAKVFQFEFFVITEKNIFVYKIFLSLNISDFSLYFMWKLQPISKRSPTLSHQPSSENQGPVKPMLFQNSVAVPTSPPQQKRVESGYGTLKFTVSQELGLITAQ